MASAIDSLHLMAIAQQTSQFVLSISGTNEWMFAKNLKLYWATAGEYSAYELCGNFLCFLVNFLYSFNIYLLFSNKEQYVTQFLLV